MRILAAAGLAVLALALAGCKAVDSADPNIATPPAGGGSAPASAHAKAAKPKVLSTTRTITYRVGGSASSGSITYSTPSGQEQQNGVDLPWKKTLKVRKGDFAMLDVTVQNGGSGTVTCEIDVDGQKVKAGKSSGAYAIVSCDHALGF